MGLYAEGLGSIERTYWVVLEIGMRMKRREEGTSGWGAAYSIRAKGISEKDRKFGCERRTRQGREREVEEFRTNLRGRRLG
jgi:hypothetical protein